MKIQFDMYQTRGNPEDRHVPGPLASQFISRCTVDSGHWLETNGVIMAVNFDDSLLYI